MNLVFTKAEEVDGDISVSGGEISGMVQVYWVPINDGKNKTTVSNVGTILVDTLRGGIDSDLEMTGSVTEIHDLTVSGEKAPKTIRVSGTLRFEFGSKKVSREFEGILHPTGYLKDAWEAILSPTWTPGHQNF